jgi:ADP-heptose:LPS heptosyltransferase
LKRIIISRTDSIGDVVLTLPLAGLLKKYLPECTLYFLGKSYTRPVIEACTYVDRFLDKDELISLDQSGRTAFFKALKADAIIHVFPDPLVMKSAFRACIPKRIGTAGRRQSWFWCNCLVWLPRKSSTLHETQLNVKLLKPFKISTDIALEEIPSLYGLQASPSISQNLKTSKSQKLLLLHPKSKGSAREWGLENFGRLIELIPSDKYHVCITGTEEERAMMLDFLEKYRDRITDMTGKLTLPGFIGLIASSDALVAASTGPLHIAAALGKKAIGLYAPILPIWPKRWAPVGIDAHSLVKGSETCDDCINGGDCHCIRDITPESVAGLLS